MKLIDKMENTINKFPQFPKKLPGTFWGITCIFNPQGYKNKVENYKIFRKVSKKQGLNLITVECAFGDNPFSLKKEDADILIQVRSNSILWQKERLLNIGFNNLPEDCDKIAWIDADIIFLNDNWVKETSDLLEKYVVVKPNKFAVRISKKDSDKIKENITEGKSIDIGKINKYSKEFSFIKNDLGLIVNSCFSWASRKEVFNNIGFYDKMIVGGGDGVMSASFCGHLNDFSDFNLLNSKLKIDFLKWDKDVFSRVKNSVYLINGEIIHLYHGSILNRLSKSRYYGLVKYDFDPNNDIKLNSDNCFEWSSSKKGLHSYLKNYFNFRNENDVFFKKIKNSFYFFKKRENNFYINFYVGRVGILIKRISPNLHKFIKNKLFIF